MKYDKQAKISTMILLVAGSILLTFYFHRYLGTGTVFTHLFYIPIILGALWWGRAGISVALIMSAVLILSHRLIRTELSGVNDYFRAMMFLVVSLVVVMLKERMVRAESAQQLQSEELRNRVRELSCLYTINRLCEDPDMKIKEIFRETVKLLWESGKEENGFSVRLLYENKILTSEVFVERSDRICEDILANGKVFGRIELHMNNGSPTAQRRMNSTGEFLRTVARRLGKIVEHEKAHAEVNRYRSHLEDLVHERTEELVMVNRQLREEIVQREQTETSLRESENRYRLLFENANEAIYIAIDGLIHFSNPALSALTGYSMPSLLRSPFADLVYAEDKGLVTERYRKRIAGESVPSAYSFRIVNADGEIRWVEINTVLIQWQGQPATLNFLRDITDRKKMESSINQIQRLEAVGALAGGIAHQFNNALSGITGYIDLLTLSASDNPDVARYCAAMLKSAHSMTGLTHQLLSYARGGKYQARELDLPMLIRDVLPLMTSSDEKQIRIETSLSPQTPRVEADAVQMQMVLLAVINNGAEAIERNGHIRIETFPARIDQAAAEAFNGLPPGEYAGLSIADNGKGMSDEVRKRIFEPFFTTHFPGRGMGMAAAYGIIKHHGGYIFVDSEVGRGTVVHILLPPCSESTLSGSFH